MKVYGKVENALVMTKKVTDGVKDPTKKYFTIGVVKDDELGELRCSEEVYNQVELYSFYNFGTTYNTQYDSFSLEAAQLIGSSGFTDAGKGKASK